jgi:NAD(P)-dependent dehydrogenase (short-subunit alcohol dehydrogenase family)
LVLTSEVHAVALNLKLPDSARQLVTKASELWGGLDILVTNAGAAAQGGFFELDDDAWPAGFGLKMFANLRVIRHAWPLLKESSGHVVMIGGGTARTPDHRLSLVSAVNGGIAALSKSIAEQGIQDGIHVNLVQPGVVKTSRRQKLLEKWAAQDGLSTDEYIRRTVQQLPAMGTMALANLTGEPLQQFVSNCKLSPKTVKNLVATLSIMWNTAKAGTW